MKDEYDFERSERGRFYRPDASLTPRLGVVKGVDGRDNPRRCGGSPGHDERQSPMPSADLRDHIEDLETRIEALAATAEQCRKIILFAKATIVVGGVVLVAIVLGVLKFTPVAMICGMAAVLGGIVVFGSNRSTMEQTVLAMRSAEAERNALIGQIGLRVVDG
jgi:hypothetical protein